MCIDACMLSVYCVHTELVGFRKGCQIPWDWSYRWLCVAVWCWKSNPHPLERTISTHTVEPSSAITPLCPPKKIPLRDKAHDFSCLSGSGNWWSHLALYFWFYSKEKFRFRAWLTWTEETNEFNVSLQHRRGFRFWLDHKRRLTDPENSRICNYDLIGTILIWYKRSVCVTIFVSNN